MPTRMNERNPRGRNDNRLAYPFHIARVVQAQCAIGLQQRKGTSLRTGSICQRKRETWKEETMQDKVVHWYASPSIQ